MQKSQPTKSRQLDQENPITNRLKIPNHNQIKKPQSKNLQTLT